MIDQQSSTRKGDLTINMSRFRPTYNTIRDHLYLKIIQTPCVCLKSSLNKITAKLDRRQAFYLISETSQSPASFFIQDCTKLEKSHGSHTRSMFAFKVSKIWDAGLARIMHVCLNKHTTVMNSSSTHALKHLLNMWDHHNIRVLVIFGAEGFKITFLIVKAYKLFGE